MSKQIVVPNHAWAGSYHFTASDPATGHVRPPARRPRNLWRRVDPDRQHGDAHAPADVEPAVPFAEPASLVAAAAVVQRGLAGDADLAAVRVAR